MQNSGSQGKSEQRQAKPLGGALGISLFPDERVSLSVHVAPPIPDHQMLRCIGRGSYGEVWLARNAIGTLRAVKVVYQRTFQDRRPYEREFEGVQKYEPISRSNEGLVDVLQIGRNDAEGYFYYVMELADTLESPHSEIPDLSSNLVDSPTKQSIDPSAYAPKTLAAEIRLRGRLPVADCITLGMTLNLALGQLHRNGLIHRDVKPSNIIFIAGVPKLADIGLVTGLDATLSYGGTEGFIPPEGATSPQADIYALGKVLYEASTGKDRQEYPEPFTRLGLDSESKALMELNAVLLKACAPNPKERYASAEEMNADLALLNSGKSVKQKHALERRLKRVTRLAIAAAAVIVLGVVPYFLVVKEWRVARDEARRAVKAELLAKQREAESQGELWESYLAQARADRYSHQVGRRFAGLDLLKKAAQLRPALEVRNEAIACLALADLKPAKECRVPSGHKVRTFDSEFQSYAVADEEGNISVRRLWDGIESARVRGFGYKVACMRFSPKGRLLAASYITTNELPLKIWDLEQRDIACVPDVKWDRGMAFSSDETRIAVINPNESVLIYDLKSARLLLRIPFSPLAGDLAFDPRGRTIAISTEEDGNVDVWDVEAGHRVQILKNGAQVFGVAWNASGKLLAAACMDGYIHIWDAESGQQQSLLGRHEGAAVSVQFSRSGDLLASAGWDERLIFWSVRTGKELCSAAVSDYFCPFSSDDRHLLCAVSYEKLGLFEIASGRECRLLSLEGSPTCLATCAFFPDGQFLAAGDGRGLHFWHVKTGEYVSFHPTDEEILSLGFNSSRKTLITAGRKTVKEWTFQRITHGSSISMSLSGRELGPSRERRFDDIGRNEIVLTKPQGDITAIDLATGQPKSLIHHGILRSHFAALNPRGDLCAVGSWLTNFVSLCDVETGKRIKTLSACRSTRTLSFSPDNHWLALGGAEEYRFFDTSTWQLACSIPRKDTGDLRGIITFSPDSRIAALTYSGQVIRLVDPATGREFATLEPSEPRNVFALAFSPDGSQLAATTWPNLIQLWDLRLIRSELASMNLNWDLPPYRKSD